MEPARATGPSTAAAALRLLLAWLLVLALGTSGAQPWASKAAVAPVAHVGPEKRADLLVGRYIGVLLAPQPRKDAPFGKPDAVLPDLGRLVTPPNDAERAAWHVAAAPRAGRARVRPPSQGPPPA